MSRETGTIRGPIGRTRARIAVRIAARTAARVPAVTLALCAAGLVGGPSASAQQATYSPSRVVPPRDAYVEGRRETLPRWRIDPDAERVLRVYFAPPPASRSDLWTEPIRAMEAWNAVGGIPILFRVTRLADSAEVRFRWVARFDARQAGTTDWETDAGGWLRSAVVTLALEHDDGTPMSDEFLRLVTQHELGHVIGLPHSEAPADVMHPGNRSLRLTDRDIRSARQLYERLGSERVEGP